MIIRELVVGPIASNCYILGCDKTKKACIIDPGDEADRIIMECAKNALTVTAIVNTHGHFDHVGGNRRVKEVTGAPIYIHKADAPMLEHLAELARAWGMRMENSPPADKFIDDGDTVNFGEQSLTVLATPGHSLGSVSLLWDNVVFAGDTLFAGSIGRTDFPGGSHPQLLASVREKLFVLPDTVKVYTGHGPATTIGQEKRFNPFFS